MPDRDWIIIISLGIAFGSIFFFNDIMLRDFGPLWVSFARVSTAALGGWIFVLATGRYHAVPVARMPQLVFMGIFMFSIPFSVYPLAQQFVASGVAGIVNALTPVAVVIVSHFWPGGERATWLKSLGVLAGFIGIVFLTIPALGPGTDGQLFGTLVTVLAPLSYAIGLNYVRRLRDLDIALMATWSFTFAAILLFPLAMLVEGPVETIQPTTWVAIAIAGFLITGALFIISFMVIARAGATKTSTLTFISPITALLVGWLFLNESLGPLHFLGMAAIFLGLFLIDGKLFQRWFGQKVN